MRIAVTGPSGMIGSGLIPRLTAAGHQASPVVRSTPQAGDIAWRPDSGQIDAAAFEGVDAVIHLAGEPMTAGRLTAERRRRIFDSRVDGTRLLSRAVAERDDPPKVLLCASGINYYGDHGDEVITEDTGPGRGFFADLIRAWEAGADPARAAGIRVVHLRTGISQHPAIGALARQLPFFRLGVGGNLGSGKQYWSWIAFDDVLGLYEHALSNDEVSGPLNVTAPNPVTNAEHTRTLAAVLGRPAVLPVPTFGPRFLFGKTMDELIFTSMRVLPAKALATGYRFRFTELEPALRHALGR